MNIAWNPIEGVFIAEFSSDFQGDLEAVKLAGFRPLGVPPPWIWHAPAPGVTALNRLRLNRPASGLTITPEALAIFEPLARQEAANAEVKKQLAEQKKQVKKEQKQSSKCNWLPPGKDYLGVEDLPPMPPFVFPHPTSKLQPIGTCRVCKEPTYGWPDLEDICLWCEAQRDKQ